MENTDQSKLKRKIILWLLGGILLLATQFYYFHFLLMLAGAGCLLFAFLSIKSAEGDPYKKEDNKQLMYYPLAVGVLAGAIAFWYNQNILFSIFSGLAALGLYTLVLGKILLNFNGYKVYSGFYAYVAGFVFTFAGLTLVIITLTTAPTQYWPKPTKNWYGKYQIELEPAQDTCAHVASIDVSDISDDRYYQSGQYEVKIRSLVIGCDSDSSVMIPIFDDLFLWGIEKGDSLLLVKKNEDQKNLYDTLFIWTRENQSIRATPLQFDYKVISPIVVNVK